MSLKGLRFTLNIDGLAETSTAVVGFSLYQHHSTPFTLAVDIASDLPDLAAADFLEKNAVLTIWQGTGAQRYVTGIISEVTLGENNHWQMRYHLTIVPPLWRCGLRQNFRIFLSRISRPSPPPCLMKMASRSGRLYFMNPIRHASSAFSTEKVTSLS